MAITKASEIERNQKGQFVAGKATYGLTHGMFGTRFYHKYWNARRHCKNEKAADYHNYGGRGIKIEWSSFEEFRNDMYEDYVSHVAQHGERETTLERMNVNGNYCKENCRWATQKEQARNKRNSNPITINGESYTAVEWQEKTGVNKQTILSRLKRGWSGEKLISTKRHHRYEHTKS